MSLLGWSFAVLLIVLLFVRSVQRVLDRRILIIELLAQHGEMQGLSLVELSKGKLQRGAVYVDLAQLVDRGVVVSRKVNKIYSGDLTLLYRLVE